MEAHDEHRLFELGQLQWTRRIFAFLRRSGRDGADLASRVTHALVGVGAICRVGFKGCHIWTRPLNCNLWFGGGVPCRTQKWIQPQGFGFFLQGSQTGLSVYARYDNWSLAKIVFRVPTGTPVSASSLRPSGAVFGASVANVVP